MYFSYEYRASENFKTFEPLECVQGFDWIKLAGVIHDYTGCVYWVKSAGNKWCREYTV